VEPPASAYQAELVLDDRREGRLGFDEAIYCAGKATAQLEAILAVLEGKGRCALLTRLDADRLAGLPAARRSALDYEPRSRTAVFAPPGAVPRPAVGPARVGVVTAGSSDVPVALEAVRTLGYYGVAAREVYDVGVAGLWRLLERVEELARLPVLIVCAGMDAALPSVLGGLVPGLVIAVPTATGYGVSADGETPLRAALASCAPGVVVVNIGNGYGAACAALRVLGRRGDAGAAGEPSRAGA
jgi:NCAIR mutase (PurE)-related protein